MPSFPTSARARRPCCPLSFVLSPGLLVWFLLLQLPQGGRRPRVPLDRQGCEEGERHGDGPERQHVPHAVKKKEEIKESVGRPAGRRQEMLPRWQYNGCEEDVVRWRKANMGKAFWYRRYRGRWLCVMVAVAIGTRWLIDLADAFVASRHMAVAYQQRFPKATATRASSLGAHKNAWLPISGMNAGFCCKNGCSRCTGQRVQQNQGCMYMCKIRYTCRAYLYSRFREPVYALHLSRNQMLHGLVLWVGWIPSS